MTMHEPNSTIDRQWRNNYSVINEMSQWFDDNVENAEGMMKLMRKYNFLLMSICIELNYCVV